MGGLWITPLQFSFPRDGSLRGRSALTLAAFAAPRNPRKGKPPLNGRKKKNEGFNSEKNIDKINIMNVLLIEDSKRLVKNPRKALEIA